MANDCRSPTERFPKLPVAVRLLWLHVYLKVLRRHVRAAEVAIVTSVAPLISDLPWRAGSALRVKDGHEGLDPASP